MNEWKETEIGLMPTNWQEYTIDDLIENIIDNRGKTPPPATSGYKLIETYQVSVDKIFPMYDDTQQKYVSEATYKTWFRSGHPQQDDILFTTVGERVPQFCLVDKTLICIAQNLIALRVNKKIVNPLYLLNYFRQEKFIKQVKNILLTTAQPSVKVPHLLALRIYLPSTDYQDKISQLLSCLDNKIDNLRRQNETLEKIAQTLFKHWFIDFEFPKDDGKPYKSSGGAMVASELGDIPEGWCVGKLENFCTVFRGSSPRPISSPVFFKNGNIPWIKIADATRSNSIYLSETREHCTEAALPYTRLLKKGSLILSNSATIGVPMILNLEGCIHDGWLSFKDYKLITRNFLFFILVNKLSFLIQYADGSVQKNLNIGILNNMDFILPNLKIINKFTNFSQSIFDKILSNEKQIQTLTKTRDTLLPKLMSGQIRVKD